MGGAAKDSLVFVVGGSEDDRQSLVSNLQASGYRVREFAHPREAADAGVDADCYVIDVVAASGGLRVLDALSRRRLPPLVILSSPREGVSAIVRVLPAANDVDPDRPFDIALVQGVRAALGLSSRQEALEHRRRELQERLHLLSDRCQGVLYGVMRGWRSSDIARDLGVDVRTVERDRRHIMQVLGVETVAGLARVVMIAAGTDVREPVPSPDEP